MKEAQLYRLGQFVKQIKGWTKSAKSDKQELGDEEEKWTSNYGARTIVAAAAVISSLKCALSPSVSALVQDNRPFSLRLS